MKKILYKMFIIVFISLSSILGNPLVLGNLEKEVTIGDGTKVIVGGGNQQQLDEWSNHATTFETVDELFDAIEEGGLDHAKVDRDENSVACHNGASARVVDPEPAPDPAPEPAPDPAPDGDPDPDPDGDPDPAPDGDPDPAPDGDPDPDPDGNPDPDPDGDPDPDPDGDPDPDPDGDPDPDPDLTVTTTTSACSSYIASWSTHWSICEVTGSWSNDGKIKCIQAPSFTANRSSCGSQTCKESCDDDGNCSTSCGPCNTSSCPPDAPKPTTPPATITINALNTPSSTCNNIYADNSSSCEVSLNISASTKQNKGIKRTPGTRSITNIEDESGENSDRINNSGTALNFGTVSSSGIPTSTAKSFSVPMTGIKSRSPFKSNSGDIGFNLGGTKMTVSSVRYSFLKPYIGELNVDPMGFIIGNQQKLILTPKKESLSGLSGESGLKTENLDTLTSSSNGYYIQYTTGFNNMLSDGKSELQFILNYTGTDQFINNVSIESDPYVLYDLDGNTVRYYLSDGIEPDDRKVTLDDSSYSGIRIIGYSQAIGNQKITNQQRNFSSISTSEFRNKFKSNVLKSIRGMVHEQKNNGILYLDINNNDDIVYEDDISNIYDLSDVSTIVIKNGNLIIDSDIVDMKGIVLIRDHYDDDHLGNIFIKNDVKKINAYIYGDGGFISIWDDAIGFSNYTDSYERTTGLDKQLILEGRLYTRNTIGGSIGEAGTYKLPGGKKTGNYHKSLMYDLNKFRTGNKGHTTSGYAENFIVKYHIGQSPKLFE
ncbi:hypothetical protein [Candidatus Vampirococcus lugosii]|uniref:4Fe-4S ferredoxin-type domain-containing protein n=1 Tax=Candidatus Vampirococcus lugosii TaxID=2789015 RepID=A0ABS5QJU6_9BACT|nr:hypothetical protein [Candidatus Vampirococcus lugosii]MBS8121540.1 hypothetical protein [Candidatus Vampirococcus lugosii]